MTQKQFGETGCETLVYTHHHFREDAQSLYGFPTREECLFFEALISTHGVGPSLGLSILSTHSPNQLANILADEDSDALCLVPESEKNCLTTYRRVAIENRFGLYSSQKQRIDSDESLTQDSRFVEMFVML